MIRNAILWAYDNLVVGLVVAIVTLYIASGVIGNWVAWIVVPSTLVLSVICLSRFWICLWDNGAATWVYEKMSYLWNGTITIFGNVYYGTNVSKISRVLWIIALFNASLLIYFAYVNIDILQIFNTLFILMMDFIRYITNPIAIMESFDVLLKKMYIRELLTFLRDAYFIPTIKAIEKGDPSIVFGIILMTLGLFGLGYIPVFFSFIFISCRSMFGDHRTNEERNADIIRDRQIRDSRTKDPIQ